MPARPEMPFVVCKGCGKRLRETTAGYPRAHQCVRPAGKREGIWYYAEVWARSYADMDAPATRIDGRAFEDCGLAKRWAARQFRAATPGHDVVWVRVVEGVDTLDGTEVTGRAWDRDLHDGWERNDVPASG